MKRKTVICMVVVALAVFVATAVYAEGGGNETIQVAENVWCPEGYFLMKHMPKCTKIVLAVDVDSPACPSDGSGPQKYQLEISEEKKNGSHKFEIDNFAKWYRCVVRTKDMPAYVSTSKGAVSAKCKEGDDYCQFQ